MRKSLPVFIFILYSIIAHAQVTVTASAGPSASSVYSNLSSAFTAINAGTHQGAIVIDISAGFSEAVTAVINASGAGSANYASILIRPVADNISISLATPGGRGVIELNGADNVTIDGDNPNTPGVHQNLTIVNTASNTATFTSVIRLALQDGTVADCNNISIVNCNVLGSGTGRNVAGATTEITSWGIIVAGNAQGATQTPSPLASSLSNPGSAVTVSNLHITNNVINNVSRAIAVNGSTPGMAGGLVISNNIIGNSLAGSPDQVCAIGITIQGSDNARVTGNTVYLEGYIANTNVNKAIDFGTIYSAGNGAVIENNMIGRVHNNYPQGSGACGIHINAGNNHIIRNNFIADVLNNQTTGGSSSIGPVIGAFGIRIAGGTGSMIVHNSVHLSGQMPGAINANLTAAFIIVSSAQSGLVVKNNIFSNVISAGNPAGTRNVAIYLPSNASAAMNLSLNNNAYFGSTDALNRLAQVGTIAGTGEYRYETFDPSTNQFSVNFRSYSATLNTAGNNDSASFGSVLPAPFVSATDLHIPNGTSALLESKGTSLSVATDIDGEARSNTTPDIGADEFTGTYIDPVPPIIGYTLFTNTLCATGSRSVKVHISDAHSGVNVNAGARPRIWFRKATNANVLSSTNDSTTDGWKYTETSSVADSFLLAIDYTRIFGGVAAGDMIEYFITAQDAAATPNVTVSGATLSISASTVALSPTNFPVTGAVNSYNINAGGVSGNITVGAGGTFTSLTGFNGLFAALNNSGLTANVNALIADANITETASVPLQQMAQGCGGAYTLTIKPATGVTPAISGDAPNDAILKILSDHVIIDSLTIANTNSVFPSVVLFGSKAAIPVANSTLQDCTIINGSNTASAVVISDGNAMGAPGYFSNIIIRHNSIQRAFAGCFINAVPATGNGNGVLIDSNDFSAAGTNAIRLTAISVQGASGVTISNNIIGNFLNTTDFANLTGIWVATGASKVTVSHNAITNLNGTSTAPRGIAVSTGFVNSDIRISDNTISNLTSSSTGTTSGIFVLGTTAGVTIERNKISNIKNTNSSGFGSNGIALNSTLNPANVNVSNNFISDVAANGVNGFTISSNGYGIIVASGGGYNIDHNTVWLNTNQVSNSGLPAAMMIVLGVNATASINLRNNIFINTQTVGTNRYAIFCNTTNTVFSTINNNSYFSLGPNVGRLVAANYSTLAGIQSGFGGNSNSIIYQPSFVSSTDLHLSNTMAGANWCLDGKGMNLLSMIPFDVDADTRSNPPDIGADEFTPTGFVVNDPAAVCPGTAVDLTAPAVTTGSMTGLTFSYFTDATATIPLPDPTAVTVAGTYYIKAVNGTCSLIMPVTVTVATAPTIIAQPADVTVCDNGATAFSATAANATGYQWQVSDGLTWANIANAANAVYSIATVTAAMHGNSYRVIVTNGCNDTSHVAVLNVNSLPHVSISAVPARILLPAQTTTIISTVDHAGGNYTWYHDGRAFGGNADRLNNLTVNDQGTFSLVYTDLNGCMNHSPDLVLLPASSDNVYIYPNPSHGHFTIRLYNHAGEKISIAVYDTKGSKLFSKQARPPLIYSPIEMDLGMPYSDGIYTVEIRNEGGKKITAKKVVIIH